MRTIDADALFREMEKAQWYNNADRDEIAEELVLNAPTIEPQRKKGKWINIRHDNIAECDQCGITGRAWMNFCFACGADMREEGADETR